MKRKNRKYGPAEIAQIRRLAKIQGLTRQMIADKLDMHKSEVTRLCVNNSIKSIARTAYYEPIPEDTQQKIIDLFKKKSTLNSIAKTVGHSVHIVNKILIETGTKTPVKRKNVVKHHTPPTDEKSEPEEETSYYVSSIKFPKACNQAPHLPEATQCKFPVTDKLPYRFCTNAAEKGRVYCQDHINICYAKNVDSKE